MSIHQLLRVAVLLAFAPLALWQSGWAQDAEAQENAAERIVRLPPSAFSELPRNVAQNLQERGCTVPQAGQPKSSASKNNVLHGEFAQGGQQDWVVLCSRNRPVSSLPANVLLQIAPKRATVWISTILVYFGGSTAKVSEFGEGEDMFNMLSGEDVVAGKTVFTGYAYVRFLHEVGPAYITEHIQAYGEPDAHYPPIDHSGIDDPTLDKSSVVHYFHEGRWMELPGAD